MTTRATYTLLLSGVAGLGACVSPETIAQTGLSAGNQLVFQEDFTTQGSMESFYFSDRDAWQWMSGSAEDVEEGTFMELTTSSDYRPPHRSPHSIALVRHVSVKDFVLELEVAQTGREYGHRDLCFFFGFVDRAHYYYVHLATSPDPNAHNVFLVDGAARRPLGPVPAEGVDWGEPGSWHKVRIERVLEKHSIRVSFDGQLVQDVRDVTFPEGGIGFGSFDDTGRVRSMFVWSSGCEVLTGGDPFR